MWFILTLVFGTTTLVFGYTTYNLYNKVEFYQEWYDKFASTVEGTYQQLKRLDTNGAFEAEDEVGMFFDSLREMMKNLFKLGFYDSDKVDQDFN
jgi:hypothetical protein